MKQNIEFMLLFMSLEYLLVQAFVLIVQLFSLKIFIFLIIEELAQLPAILVSGVLNYILLKNYIFNK